MCARSVQSSKSSLVEHRHVQKNKWQQKRRETKKTQITSGSMQSKIKFG